MVKKMKILFWNLKGNKIEKYIINCLQENEIDIAIFAEFKGIDFEYLIDKLDNSYYHPIDFGGCEKITLIARRSISIEIKQEQDRYTIYKANCNGDDFILTGVHMPDRMSSDVYARIAKAGRIVNDIKNLEISSKCKKTIIIGDFNANPYDDEMLAMNSFNAVLFKDEILRAETKSVGGVSYRRFFNPILHFISEDTKLYGSFYYLNGSTSPIWHCLDQVLVSRSLADCVSNIEYLKEIKNISLLKRVKPNAEISDHLPLVVTLEE